MKTLPPLRRSNNARLGFTVPQQVLYRAMVESAWNAFCRQTHVPPNDRAARRDWYEAHLEAATGKTTTTVCNRTSDFEHASSCNSAARTSRFFDHGQTCLQRRRPVPAPQR